MTKPNELGEQHDPATSENSLDRQLELSVLSAEERENLEQARYALSILDRIRADILHVDHHSTVQLPNGLDTEDGVDHLTRAENWNADSDEAEVNETFGRFQILETVGQGGFAMVFRARDPKLNRDVALKIPKAHVLQSAEAKIRFEREARAAAMLSHPAIVPVFESGNVGPVSFIASEFCEGEDLASWFGDQGRTVDMRFAASIVQQLAEAVQHAHQRGIIHRDLKPANVLLDTSTSAGPMDSLPRITDFGLAKQIGSTEESFTQEGVVVGTPAYMSPEQAKGEIDIGAAADIYSLGVILFELLSGQLPFEKSTHLQTLRAVESEPAPALNRIDRSIPRDLSAICQKCLAKSPALRYATAHDLANDLSAWLEDRPVTARPVSLTQRFRQWFRRNTALGSALVFAFASLAIGLGVSLWQWSAADTHAKRADAQLVKTKAANRQSENRRHQIEKFTQSLTGLFEDLDLKKIGHSSQPLHEVMAQRLIVVGSQLEQGMVEEPLVEADLKTSLAQSLIALGFATEAIEFAESAVAIRRQFLTEDNLLIAASISCLGEAYRDAGRYQDALEQHELSRQIYKDQLEEDHTDILAATSQVAVDLQYLGKNDEAIDLCKLVLSRRLLQLEESDPRVLSSMNNLANGFMSNDQFELAQPIYERTLEIRKEVLGENDYDLLTSMDQLARCYLAQNKTSEAFPLLEETLQRRTDTLGETHHATLISLSGMASCYRAEGKLDEALEVFKRVFELRKIRHGETHELTYTTMHDLGATYYSLKQFDQARVLLEQAYEGIQDQLHRDHPKALQIRQSLAAVYYEQGNYDRAIAILNETLKLARESLPPSHPNYLETLRKLARVLLNRGKYDDAIEPFSLLVDALIESRGFDDLQTLNARAELGNCYCWAGNYEAAIEKLEPALASDQRIASHDYYRRSLRAAYARGGYIEKFQPIANQDLAKYRTNLEPMSDKLRSRLTNLGLDCLHVKNYEMAKPLLAESIEIFEAKNTEGAAPPNLRSMLGEALMGIGDLQAAKPLLQSGYEALKKQEESIHPLARGDTMIEAAQRLLRYYEQVGESAEAEIIQAELQQLRDKYDR